MTAPGERRMLRIVGLGHVEPGLLRWLAQELERSLPCDCRPLDAEALLPASLPVSAPSSLDADATLSQLIERFMEAHHPTTSPWLLAVTSADLRARHDHVFGEATVGGCCALVSIARLSPPTARSGEERALLRLRLLKESMHEIGHLAGFAHCSNRDCVMSASATLAAVDRKSSEFCARCLRQPGAHQVRT